MASPACIDWNDDLPARLMRGYPALSGTEEIQLSLDLDNGILEVVRNQKYGEEDVSEVACPSLVKSRGGGRGRKQASARRDHSSALITWSVHLLSPLSSPFPHSLRYPASAKPILHRCSPASTVKNDHTTVTAPLPVCSAKLSTVGPG